MADGAGGEDGDADEDGKRQRVTGVAQRYMHLWREGFGEVSEKEARAVLAQYRNLIVGAVKQFPRSLLERGMLDESDLEQLASIIVVQSWTAFDPQVGTFRGWALYRVRQRFSRIREDLERLRDHEVEETRAAPPTGDSYNAGLVCEVASGWDALDEVPEDLEDAVAERQRLAVLEQLLERLPLRQAYILRGLRDGRQLEDVAQDLGITRQRADQIRKVAMDAVRAMFAAYIADREGDVGPEARPTLLACPAMRSGSFSLAS